MKRIIIASLIASMCIFVPTMADENEDRIAEIEQQIAELQAELKELKGDTMPENGAVIFQNEELIITYDGVSEGWTGIEINFVFENIGNRAISVQCRDTSVNGFMEDMVGISSDILPGKKAKDHMNFMGKDYTIDNVEEVETRFHIFDSDNWIDSYDTDLIQIIG